MRTPRTHVECLRYVQKTLETLALIVADSGHEWTQDERAWYADSSRILERSLESYLAGGPPILAL